MADSSNIEHALEQAIIDWIGRVERHGIELGITPRHHQEDDADRIRLPAVVVRASRIEEEPPGTGIWRMDVEVTLLIQADDTAESAAASLWAKLMDILAWSDLATELSAAPDFHCHAVLFNQASQRQVTERHWLQSMNFTAWAMAMDD